MLIIINCLDILFSIFQLLILITLLHQIKCFMFKKSQNILPTIPIELPK